MTYNDRVKDIMYKWHVELDFSPFDFTEVQMVADLDVSWSVLVPIW